MSFATTPSTPLRWEDGAARRVRGGRRRDDTIAREGRAEDEEGRAMDDRRTIADCEAREGGMRDARRIDRDGARTVGVSAQRAQPQRTGRSRPRALDADARAPRSRVVENAKKTSARRDWGRRGRVEAPSRPRASVLAFGVHPARATSLVPPGLDPNLRATVEARGGPQRAGVCPGAATVLPLILILGVVAAVMSLARDHAF
jgi:hypothetical protein